MSPPDPNGAASIREVHTLLQAVYRRMDEDKDAVLAAIAGLDSKYVIRDACRTRHEALPTPKDQWGAVIFTGVISAVVVSILTTVAAYALTH